MSAAIAQGVGRIAPVGSSPDADQAALLQWLAEVRDDPLAFVLGAFPWGVPGTALESSRGPVPWAAELMERVRLKLISIEAAIAEALRTESAVDGADDVVQEAVASGHGIAKSATVAQLTLWAFMTYPDCRGVVTANTETQLKTKTWAELGKWFNLCWFARDHFTLNATSLISKDPSRERTWRIDMIPWSEKNTEAFAGLHNKGKRLLLIFDEGSAIPDIIWEVAEGALTDANTQIIWLVFGNPTRNIGRFRECFAGGRFAKFWHSTQIDSRTVPITNKARLQSWIEAYGEDSDFVRIRVLGQFPRTGDMEFFSAAEIDEAMSREVPYTERNTPLALGVDVARFGRNNSVLFYRKGRDARTIDAAIHSRLSTTALAHQILAAFERYRPDGIFIDEGGVGGGVVDRCREMRLYVTGVQFGSKDDITGIVFDNAGERYVNKRSAMYGALRAWLKGGALPQSPRLRDAMLSIRYTINKADQIQLLSKEDILADNPDIDLDTLDALALTFGGPLAANPAAGGDYPAQPLVESEYDPYATERLLA